MRSVAIYILLVFSLAGCSLFELGGSDGPGELPIEMLRAAPDTVVVDGTSLVLKTYMWRDFMPIAPEDGRSLIAIFRILTADSTAIPDELVAEEAWVVHKEDVWDKYFTGDEPPPSDRHAYQMYRVARDGPKFGPNVHVDAVVRLVDGDGGSHLLKAEQQYIERTD